MKLKLYDAIEKLYDLLALDKALRKEVLKELVEDESICFMLSISSSFTRSRAIDITRGGQNANIDYQLGQLLIHIDANNTTFGSYFKTLDMKTQVVMKEMLKTTSRFDTTIFYGFAEKVFSKKEILAHLQPSIDIDENLRYFISDSPKYYFKTRTYKLIHNNVPKGLEHQTPSAHQTILYDYQGATKVIGNINLGDYIKGEGAFPKTLSNFTKAASLVAIQYKINKMVGDKFAIVFTKDGIKVLTKESLKLTCDIIDFILSDDFEVIGVWIEHNDKVYEIMCHVPQTMIDRGLDGYTISITANELVNGSLNNISFTKFNLKGED